MATPPAPPARSAPAAPATKIYQANAERVFKLT